MIHPVSKALIINISEVELFRFKLIYLNLDTSLKKMIKVNPFLPTNKVRLWNKQYNLGITEHVEQLNKATEIAETIAKQAPLGIKQTIITANLANTQTIPEGIAEHFLTTIKDLMLSEDGQEGFKSFIERREAVFKGR